MRAVLFCLRRIIGTGSGVRSVGYGEFLPPTAVLPVNDRNRRFCVAAGCVGEGRSARKAVAEPCQRGLPFMPQTGRPLRVA